MMVVVVRGGVERQGGNWNEALVIIISRHNTTTIVAVCVRHVLIL